MAGTDVDKNTTNSSKTSSIKFLDNVLNAYDSYTYNITLSIYEESIKQQSKIPSATDKHVIFAQTGKTAGICIKEVEISTKHGALASTMAVITDKIRVVVDEPLGFSLIDKMLLAAKSLKLQALSEIPFVMSIDFIGWDSDGNIVKQICPTKYYVLLLINVIPVLNKAGSSYELTFVPHSQKLTQQQDVSIPKPLVFNKEATLSATLNNYAKVLSDAFSPNAETQAGLQTPIGSSNKATLPKISYKFVLEDGTDANAKLSSWTMLQNSSSNSNTASAVTMDNDSSGYVIHVKENRNVFDVLLAILANTEQAYKFVCPDSTAAEASFDAEKEFTKFFTFQTTSTNKLLDSVTNTYGVEQTVTIIPKVVSRLPVLTGNMGDENAVRKLNNDNMMQKCYEYMFTGLNTEIIDLHVDLNTFWIDCLPIFTAALSPNGLSSLLTPTYDGSSISSPSINGADRLSDTDQNSSSFAQNAKDVDSSEEHEFLEDYSPDAISLEEFARQRVDRDLTRSKHFTEGMSPSSGPIGNEKVSIFSYIADNALIDVGGQKLGAPSSMLQISLTVRGDPYWLGITPEEMATSYPNKTYEEVRKTQTDFAVYQSAECNFYLRFQPPAGLDEDTGLVKTSSSSVFNVIYSPLETRSIFDRGTFKQEMHAVMNRGFATKAVQTVCDPAIESKNNSMQNNTNNSSANASSNSVVGSGANSVGSVDFKSALFGKSTTSSGSFIPKV